jgi:diguanylate cyclase (GGDEF)-like protein
MLSEVTLLEQMRFRSLLAEVQRLREVNARLNAELHTDPLTQVGNRRAYENQIADLPPKSAFIVVDVDRFKQINDTLGHEVGDRCLRLIAESIRSTSDRCYRCCYRVGGDEFVVITDVAAAPAIADRIKAAVSMLEVGGHRLSVSVGWGATYAAADAAMYQAKQEYQAKQQR